MIKHATWSYYSMKGTFLALSSGAKSPLRVITALIALWFPFNPTMADYTCPSQVNALEDSAVVSGTTASCFRFEVPPGSPFVRLQLDANVNSIDLFFSSGTNNTLEDWDRVIAVNLKGVFLCSVAVAKQMMQQRNGRIITIAGATAHQCAAGFGAYGPSKAGVVNLTKQMAVEWGKYNKVINI